MPVFSSILGPTTFKTRPMFRTMHRSMSFRQPFLYKILLILIFVVLIIISLSLWSTDNGAIGHKCFSLNDESLLTTYQDIIFLDDITYSVKKPTPGRSIFFHETSCARDGLITLNARQACAIESAAKINPSWDVFLLFASPVGFANNTEKRQPLIEALQTYPNIHMRNVNLWTYAQDTPISKWLLDGQLFLSKYLNSHTSDFLRYLSLYKYGGTYLDLDVVVQKPFDSIQPNYAGAESDKFVAAGVLNFDHDGFGHDVAEMCLNEFRNSFNGDDWGNNGPGVITRVLQKICQTKSPELMTQEHCRGFKVYPPSGFYAVPWQNWHWFFDRHLTERTLNMTKDSIVIHVWNKHSIKRRVLVGSRVAYGIVAERNCPKVYAASGIYF